MVDDVYREKYVAFIDMLGFAALVHDADTDLEKRKKVIDAIDRLKNTACAEPKTNTLTTYFSDCIVVSSDRTSAGLRAILTSVMVIVTNLLQIDILTRGGLAVGGIYHTNELMFGPAMIEAYLLEKDKAKHPRIITSKEFWADVSSAGEWAQRDFIVDDEEAEPYHFLHYLQQYSIYTKPTAGLLDYPSYAKLIRHYIAKRLRGDPSSIRDKAVWLQRYWNQTVGARGILGNVDETADLAPPNVTPARTQLFIYAPSQ